MLNSIFSNRRRCQHFRSDGSRCKGDPQRGKKFCFMHDPDQKQKQAEARRQGGQARYPAYVPVIPSSFQYQPLKDRVQIDDFLDQIGLYLQRGELDLRSARMFLSLVSLKLSKWNEEARQQYRATLVADRQARLIAREKDPWSPAYGALARAAKARPDVEEDAKEEAAKAEGPLAVGNDAGHEEKTNDEKTKDWIQQTLVADAAAQSLRELEKLKKEEEKKEKERERFRQESAKPDLPDDWQESELPSRPISKQQAVPRKAAQNEVQQNEVAQNEASKNKAAQPPEPVIDYIIYGNSPLPALRPCDTNHHGVVTEHMLNLHKLSDPKPEPQPGPVSHRLPRRQRKL